MICSLCRGYFHDATNYYRSTSATINQLQSKVPVIAWQQFFAKTIYDSQGSDNAKEMAKNASIFMWPPKYFDGLTQLMKKQSNQTLLHFHLWKLVSAKAQFLPEQYREFDGQMDRLLHTATVLPNPCLAFVGRSMGFVLAKRYMEIQNLSKSDFDSIHRFVQDLRLAFRARLTQVPWLDKISREKALFKVRQHCQIFLYVDFIF